MKEKTEASGITFLIVAFFNMLDLASKVFIGTIVAVETLKLLQIIK